MSKVQVMDHPLIQHKINYIRKRGGRVKRIQRDRWGDRIINVL